MLPLVWAAQSTFSSSLAIERKIASISRRLLLFASLSVLDRLLLNVFICSFSASTATSTFDSTLAGRRMS